MLKKPERDSVTRKNRLLRGKVGEHFCTINYDKEEKLLNSWKQKKVCEIRNKEYSCITLVNDKIILYRTGCGSL